MRAWFHRAVLGHDQYTSHDWRIRNRQLYTSNVRRCSCNKWWVI